MFNSHVWYTDQMSISVSRIIGSGKIVFRDGTLWFPIIVVFPGLFNEGIAVSYRMSTWAGVCYVSKLAVVTCFDALHGLWTEDIHEKRKRCPFSHIWNIT